MRSISMQSMRRKLSIILVICTAASILVSALLVNIAINSTFNKYMSDIQIKREESIVNFFQEVYKKDGKWTENSGAEMIHEAYMSSYCLTLKDSSGNTIWSMNPNNIKFTEHFNMMSGINKGVYNVKTFPIKSAGSIVGYIDIGQYSPVLLTEEDVNFKIAVNKSIIISVLITILITAIISLFLSKQFSKPIIEVADTSVELSKGDYEARSRTFSNILELKSLSDSINILGENLKRQDTIRKKLVSDISHEIRTPLNILQNNLEAMVDGIFPVTTERLSSLNDEVIRFGKLLDNLNVLKEFESENMTIKFEALDIKKLVSSLVKDFLPALKEKNIDIECNFQGNNDCIINGDMDKLRQVFINLLSNAVKFSYEGGKIWVEVFSNEKNVIVKVRDNGIGIDKKDLPFIFERLYRADGSRQKTEGSGIGLTIVKNIVMLHSASIEVDSNPGGGTCFTIRFNRVQAS